MWINSGLWRAARLQNKEEPEEYKYLFVFFLYLDLEGGGGIALIS